MSHRCPISLKVWDIYEANMEGIWSIYCFRYTGLKLRGGKNQKPRLPDLAGPTTGSAIGFKGTSNKKTHTWWYAFNDLLRY
jgi:hypothetical protein